MQGTLNAPAPRKKTTENTRPPENPRMQGYLAQAASLHECHCTAPRPRNATVCPRVPRMPLGQMRLDLDFGSSGWCSAASSVLVPRPLGLSSGSSGSLLALSDCLGPLGFLFGCSGGSRTSVRNVFGHPGRFVAAPGSAGLPSEALRGLQRA